MNAKKMIGKTIKNVYLDEYFCGGHGEHKNHGDGYETYNNGIIIEFIDGSVYEIGGPNDEGIAIVEKDPLQKVASTSIEADATRFRWLLNGNGYYMEGEGLCGHPPCDEDEQNAARAKIDRDMQEEIE